MSIRSLCLRGLSYLRTRGLRSSISRALEEIKNQLVRKRLVLYEMDLLSDSFQVPPLPDKTEIRNFEAGSAVPATWLDLASAHYPRALLLENIRKRFQLGARLWVLGNDREELGYIWSIAGRTLQTRYCFPLTIHDIHLDDGLIFPSHRGQGLLGIMIAHILAAYRATGFRRCYLEAAEWNLPSQKAIEKIGFRKLAMIRMRIRADRCRVFWWYG